MLVFIMGFSFSSIRKDASSYHRVCCLVMMFSLWIENCDILCVDLAATSELSDKTLASATSTNNSDSDVRKRSLRDKLAEHSLFKYFYYHAKEK